MTDMALEGSQFDARQYDSKMSDIWVARSIWPATIEMLQIISPHFCYINSTTLLASRNPSNNMLCTGDVIESGLEDTVVDRIFMFLLGDNNYYLIVETFRNNSIYRGRGQTLLAEAISCSAFACVVALVKGETPLTVDIDLPDSYGKFPLHYAAEILDPGIIELLLYLRARADSRTVKEQLLPLNLALQKFICHRRLKEWTPKHSIFKLITLLCLPKMQNQLESIGLLSWTSEGTEEEFLQYARYGKLKELAALLTVAHKKLIGPMHTVLNTIPSLQNHALSDVKKKHLLLLLEVFQRAGDAIEAYVKQEKIGVSVDQSVNTVKCLLQEAGFHLKHEDTDLNCFQCDRSELEEWSEWDSKHSIFKLIILLCLPILQDNLESIGLLAYSIDETEEEFLRLARHGKLKELAALLMVAHKRLNGPLQKVHNLSLALIRENRKQNLFLLLEVFERAGDAIEAYVKQEKYGVWFAGSSEYDIM